MKATPHPSLKALNTFGVEATAGLLISLESEEDLLSLPGFDSGSDLLLGGGSNILFASDVPGSVLLNRICGKAIVKSTGEHAWVEAGAGENWHDLVRWSLQNDLSGLENLSLIPGLAGAAPIQNIGAYGVELASVLEHVTAWDLWRSAWTGFSSAECGLGYRDSRFKSAEPGRYLVTSLRLRLDRQFKPRLDYAGLREELQRNDITHPTALQVSDAVISLRQRKLPDPAVTGNAGSFFKNPVLGQARVADLLQRFPELPAWRQNDATSKLSAAWMIEQCGFKGYREGDAGVSAQHALVLVNHGSATGMEILQLANAIQSKIHATFGVRLEPEPNIVNFDTPG